LRSCCTVWPLHVRNCRTLHSTMTCFTLSAPVDYLLLVRSPDSSPPNAYVSWSPGLGALLTPSAALVLKHSTAQHSTLGTMARCAQSRHSWTRALWHVQGRIGSALLGVAWYAVVGL
jgi:hypothetical protein